MRQSIRELAELVAATLPLEGPLIEFGSYQVAGHEAIADLRGLFPDVDYIGADMRQGPGVDRVLDLHAIEMDDDSVGAVLMLDTM